MNFQDKLNNSENSEWYNEVSNHIIGKTIYTAYKHTTRSGLTRVVKAYYSMDDKINQVPHEWMEWLGFVYDEKHEGYIVGGYGFDAGYSVVDSLSNALYGEGYKLKHQRL